MAELRARADAAMAKSAFKDAIAVYKQLHKLEPTEDWQTPLADAYEQRARALAAKKMYKEAALLWDNRAAIDPTTDTPLWYIECLIYAGRYDQAVKRYQGLDAEAKTYQQISALFAALLLAGEPAVEKHLAADAPLRQHLLPARAALQTYCQNAPAERVHEQLKAISFRSPFRDFRQLLTALLHHDEGRPDEARKLLDRIGAESPFAGLATAIQAQVQRDYGWLERLRELSTAQQNFIAARLGLDQAEQQLLQSWLNSTSRDSDKERLAFIIQHRKHLNPHQARNSALDALARYPQGRRQFEKTFGALNAFEKAQLAALQAEQREDLNTLERHWIECARLLRGDPQNPDGPLSAALIQRHVIAHILRAKPHLQDHPPPELTQNLEFSLDLDPDDKAAHLLLINLYEKSEQRKAYHEAVNRALAQFPDDSDVLQAAIRAAHSRKAFKKAAGLAQRLLQRDPINSWARNMLIDLSLAHARKSISNSKYHLAEKEIRNAEQWCQPRDDDAASRLLLMRGFLALQQGQDKAADDYIHAAATRSGDQLNAGLLLWVEAERLRIPTSKRLLQALAALPDEPAGPKRLKVFIHRLTGYLNENLALFGAVNALAKPLRKTVATQRDKADLQRLLEALARVPHFSLLQQCATSALKYQPDTPLFRYYQIYGRTEGQSFRLSDREIDRLEVAADQAIEEDDFTTAELIEDFIEPMPGYFPGPSRPLPPMPGGGPTLNPAELAALLDDLRNLPDPMKKLLLDDIFSNPDIPPELRTLFDDPPDYFDDDDDDAAEFFDPAPGPLPNRGGSKRRGSKRKKKSKKRR